MTANETSTAKKTTKKIDGETAVLETITGWSGENRSAGLRLHAIIRETAPELAPKLWYGMPGYAKDGKVLVFFRGTDKFDERYMTLGFNEVATLDDGNLWPIAYALTELTPAEEKTIAALVKKAVG
ncbi:MAG: iron chaperone [Coriobacteriia bacterium]